jgi:hypothetical protein
MPLSRHFRDAFQGIAEKFLLALILTVCAAALHYLMSACEAAHLPAWIMLLLGWVFALLVLCDALTVVCLAVALLIRVAVATFRELAEFFKQ